MYETSVCISSGAIGGKQKHRDKKLTETVSVVLKQEAQVRARATPHSNNNGGAWACITRLCDCADKPVDHDDEEEVQPRCKFCSVFLLQKEMLFVVLMFCSPLRHFHTHTATEHPLLPLFRNAGISAEATDVYMDSLRRYGYDNILALKSMASDKMLNRYVPDRSDRHKLHAALNQTSFSMPQTHLPAAEFLKNLLCVADDIAVVSKVFLPPYPFRATYMHT